LQTTALCHKTNPKPNVPGKIAIETRVQLLRHHPTAPMKTFHLLQSTGLLLDPSFFLGGIKATRPTGSAAGVPPSAVMGTRPIALVRRHSKAVYISQAAAAAARVVARGVSA